MRVVLSLLFSSLWRVSVGQLQLPDEDFVTSDGVLGVAENPALGVWGEGGATLRLVTPLSTGGAPSGPIGYSGSVLLPLSERFKVHGYSDASAAQGGLSLRLGERLSLGLDGGGLGGLRGAMTLRLGASLALAASAAQASSLGPASAPRTGFALRPFGERLQLSWSFRAGSAEGWLASGALRIVRGLTLRALFERDGLSMGEGRWGVGLSWESASLLGMGLLRGSAGEDQWGYLRVGLRRGYHRERELSPKLKLVEISISDLPELSASSEGWPWGARSAPFSELLISLERLQRDPSVRGLFLSLGELRVDLARALELRQALDRFRQSGRHLYVYLRSANSMSYVVAAAAEMIYLDHAGTLFLSGLQGHQLYLADALEAIGVRAEFIAIGDYKSAPERFTRSGPSPAALEAERSLATARYQLLLEALTPRAGATPEAAAEVLAISPLSAPDAEARGLIDRIASYQEALTHALTVNQGRYHLSAPPALPPRTRWGSVPKIALLYISGTIDERPSPTSTSAHELLQLIKEIEDDQSYRAVVLRINSPGGSLAASELLWHGLRRLRQRRPLIISLGDVAASGGYYAAVTGHQIFAHPATITGSIGLFAGKVDLSALLQRLGVSSYLVDVGPRADLFSPLIPWSEEERARIQRSLTPLYSLFLNRVDHGRPALDRDAVEALAGGRIWSGAAALERGLVDQSGGLIDALKAAAERAGGALGDFQLTPLIPAPRFELSPALFLPEIPIFSTLFPALSAPASSAMSSGWSALLSALFTPPGRPLAIYPFCTTLEGCWSAH